jgi:Secretion system C-terminal sorting domain
MKKITFLFILFIGMISNSFGQTGTLCEDAIVVTLPYTTTDDTANYADTNYEGSPGTSGCGSSFNYLNGNDVVYSYTSTIDGTIKLLITTDATYVGLFAYANCADIGQSCIGGAVSSFGGGPVSIPEFSVVNGVTYYFVISTWAAPQTAAYTLDILENTCTNPTATYSVVSDCANGEQFMINVDVTALGSATSLTVSDDQGSANQIVTAAGQVQFGPYPNTTPVIFTIANDQDASCFLTSAALTQTACPPTNDAFADAIVVLCGDSITGDTTTATLDEDNAPDGFGTDMDSRNLWYSFTGSGFQETVTLNLCNSQYDTSVLVYTGTSGNLTLVVANDDDNTCGTGLTTRSRVSFNSDGVSTYYIAVEGYNVGSFGTFTMDVSCAGVTPPAVANQICDLALVVPVDGFDLESDNSFGDISPQQTSCELFGSVQDVWFSFIAPASGTVDCTITNGTMTSANFTVYSGVCGTLTETTTACNSNITATATESLTGLTGGETYFVQVWSNAAEQGTFSLRLTDPGLATTGFNTSGFTTFPNPVKDVLNISYNKNITNVAVFNLLGQEVATKSINATQSQIDMSNLSKGTYLVKVTADNQVKTIKVIKE